MSAYVHNNPLTLTCTSQLTQHLQSKRMLQKLKHFKISFFWDVMLCLASNPWCLKDHRAFNFRAEVLYCLDPEEEEGTTDPFQCQELLTQQQSITSHKMGTCSNTDTRTSNLAFKILPSPQHLDWPWHPTSQGLFPRGNLAGVCSWPLLSMWCPMHLLVMAFS